MSNAAKRADTHGEPNLAQISTDVYKTKRPRLVRQSNGRDLVVMPAPSYEALTEALEVAAGLLRGEADTSAGRVQPNDEVQAMLRRRIAEAARLSA